MSSTGDEAFSWVQWLCDSYPVLCEVDESFIEDTFNLYGIREVIPHYKEAMQLILDVASDSDPEPEEWTGSYFNSAKDLFGLIHARFIITEKGMNMMVKLYEQDIFGTCPRMLCTGQPLLPVGLSDELGVGKVHMFCPCCSEVYRPLDPTVAELDGAYFGTTFAHMLLLCKPALCPKTPTQRYVPRVFGFRIHAPLTAAEEERSRKACTARIAAGQSEQQRRFLVDTLAGGTGPSVDASAVSRELAAAAAGRKRRKDVG